MAHETAGDGQPAPYPPVVPGTKFRRIPFPVEAPPRVPAEPGKLTRRDGRPPVPLHRTLPGLPGPAAPRSPDEMVSDWAPWPP